MINLQKILLFGWFGLLTFFGNAQQNTVLQVVTKRINKEFAYKDMYEVNIDGDRAEVSIETWDQPVIRIQIDLVAKHPDKETATRDLEYLQYITQRVKNKIYLRNYLSVPEGQGEPESKLKAVYLIKVPAECPVYLKTNYGQADIENLSNRLRVNSRFSQINMQNIRGWMDINTFFGELFGTKLDGNVAITSRRSDMTLRDLSGRFDINAQYGILNIFASTGLLDLNLHADNSQVFLHTPDLAGFHYNLIAQNSKLQLPSGMKFQINETAPGVKRVTFQPKSEYYPNITVTVNLGSLFIGR